MFNKILISAALSLAILLSFSYQSVSAALRMADQDKIMTQTNAWFFMVDSKKVSMSKNGEYLTLQLNQPIITATTERPYRIDRQLSPLEFITAWKEGPNSFKTDHPNGDAVFVLSNGKSFKKNVVFSNPSTNGTALVIDIQAANKNEQLGADVVNAVYLRIDGDLLSGFGGE